VDRDGYRQRCIYDSDGGDMMADAGDAAYVDDSHTAGFVYVCLHSHGRRCNPCDGRDASSAHSSLSPRQCALGDLPFKENEKLSTFNDLTIVIVKNSRKSIFEITFYDLISILAFLMEINPLGKIFTLCSNFAQPQEGIKKLPTGHYHIRRW